ncbi:MAG: solute carrier family 23 protein [Gemmatimonadota bacterium]
MPKATSHLIYGVDERPPSWWETILYGWQHTLVDISPFVLPLAVASAMGMGPAEAALLINYSLFAMGLATLIQTTIGNRLPIIQGPSATMTGTLAPIAAHLGPAAMWGGAFISGLMEAALGAARMVGLLRRLFPPVVAGTVVLVIAFALGQVAVRLAIGDGSPASFGLASGVIAAVLFMQVGLPRVLGGLLSRGAIFASIWIVGLGVGGWMGRVEWALLAGKDWVALPALFPYGGPGFGWDFVAAAILAAMAGAFASMVESLGDYAATCAVTEQEFTRRHMDRGIFAEGLGSVIATAVGGLPCTSYTQNIGIIGTTRVASRTVVRVAAVILMLYGLSPKFGALIVALPRPVLGGVFILVCGMIAMSGIRLIASARASMGNQLVAGTTLIASIGVPIYVQYSLGEEWLAQLPLFGRLVFSNPVVLAVLLGVGLHDALNLALGGDDDRVAPQQVHPPA